MSLLAAGCPPVVRAGMAAAMSWRGALCAFAVLLLPGPARTALAAGASASISKSFPAIPPEVLDDRSAPGYSSVFNIQGSGILSVEVSYAPAHSSIVSDQAYFQYLYPYGWDGHAFSGGTWLNGIGGRLEVLESTVSGGPLPDFSSAVLRRKVRVTNATNSLDGRLVVVPGRWYFGGGAFEQAAQTISMKLEFVANPSTISQHRDQAGGPRDNRHTRYDPEQRPCVEQGLPHYSVNTSFLNLVIEDTDFGCQSYDHNEAFRRVWNMLPDRPGMFGNGWSFAYESSLVAKPYTDGGATLTLGAGQTAAYSVAGSAGTNPVTVNYTRDTADRGPTLTGIIDAASGAGHYKLTDRETKLTHRYDYAGHDSGDHLYRLASVTDRNGNAITLAHNANGRIAAITDASGRQTRFTYDSNNRCTGMATFDGRSASYQYDAAGNLTQSVDLAGNVIIYVYDAHNYLQAMTVDGKTTSFAYATHTDGALYVSAVTEPDGTVRRFAFGPDGTTRLTEPGGGVRTYGNSNGRTTAITDELGNTTATVYNSQSLPTRITDPQGNATSLEYDADGNLTKTIDAAGNQTAYTYDANWNLTSLTDALGNTTTFLYDERDNLIATTTPLGRTTLYMHDDRGRVIRVIPPDGSSSYGFGHDEHGNLTSVTDPLGHTTNFAFAPQGLNLSAVTDALGRTTAYRYDANRRVTGVVRPDQTSIQYGHDAYAMTSMTDPADNTITLQRDPVLQVTSVTDPLGNVTRFTYNDDGDLIAAVDPLGRTSTLGYDAAHRPTSSVNPLDGRLDFGLDASGNLISLTDERGKTTSMTFDSLGALASVRDPLNSSTAITHDALGRISSITSAQGGIVSYHYDADGRLSDKKYDGHRAATYEWNANGFLTAVGDASGTRSFTRDAAGRVTAIAYPDGNGLATTYDAAGNIVSLTYGDGLTVNYSYDTLNRVAGVSFAGNSLSLAYDAAGDLTGESRANGAHSAYGYDANRQLTRVTHQNGAGIIADITYTRNAAGLITEERGTWPLSPDPAGVEHATATYDDANAVVTWAGDDYVYDADGNLIRTTDSRTLDIRYDHENRPTSITSNGVTTEYAYDGLGNRVQGRSAQRTRTFYHDSDGRLLFDIDITNAVTTNYIYAGDRLVASGSDATGYVFYHFDKTGNTLALTDSVGRVVAAFAYDPYGRVVARSGSVTTPFTYVGAYGVVERAGDLFFMRNRYYDAVTGRFIQRDPIGFAGGTNLYSYAGGNPVTGIDPTGLLYAEAGFDRFATSVRSMSASERRNLLVAGILAIPASLYLTHSISAFLAWDVTITCVNGRLAVSGANVLATLDALLARMLSGETAAVAAFLAEISRLPGGDKFIQGLHNIATVLTLHPDVGRNLTSREFSAATELVRTIGIFLPR